MSWWVIEPRDPLMVRDGRPFGLDSDGARSLDFPPPSAVAGTLRSRIWDRRARAGRAMDPATARAIAVRGPLLCSILPRPRLWAPAPRDAVVIDGRRYRVGPGTPWPEGMSDLPAGLRPVEPAVPLPDAKGGSTAGFWSGEALRAWLEAPPEVSPAPGEDDLRPPLAHERRTHVAIAPATDTGADGKLFQTDGLLFQRLRGSGEGARLVDFEQSGLLLHCAEADLEPGLITLGGERRLSALRREGGDPTWPAPALSGGRARVVLLIPAIFAEGAVPARIGGARVVAAAVPRGAWISGWDLRAGGPKKSRRLAPAGSVYWVELQGLDPVEWAARVHFHEVSSDQQDGRDGFGLAAVGVWA